MFSQIPSLALALGLLIALSTALGPIAPAALAGESSASKIPETWVAFGDSLTAGRWNRTGMVAKRTGNRIINSGKNRSNTLFALRFLQRDVLDHHPDRVFVMFGINDQFIPNGGHPDHFTVPPAEFADNLDLIVRAIQATGAPVPRWC